MAPLTNDIGLTPPEGVPHEVVHAFDEGWIEDADAKAIRVPWTPGDDRQATWAARRKLRAKRIADETRERYSQAISDLRAERDAVLARLDNEARWFDERLMAYAETRCTEDGDPYRLPGAGTLGWRWQPPQETLGDLDKVRMWLESVMLADQVLEPQPPAVNVKKLLASIEHVPERDQAVDVGVGQKVYMQAWRVPPSQDLGDDYPDGIAVPPELVAVTRTRRITLLPARS